MQRPWDKTNKVSPNKPLHWTQTPLRYVCASELGRYAKIDIEPYDGWIK